MNKKTAKVTVIMRTKNSEMVVGQALSSLFSQDYRGFHLIVVDSGSTDRTLEIVRRFPSRLIVIEASDYFPGRVLNMAVREAHGEILVFQNSDCVLLGPCVLRLLVEAVEKGAVASFARQIPRPDAWPHVRFEYAKAFPREGEAPPWLPLSLPFAAIRKQALLEQPFYEDAWGSEDTAWGVLAKARGWKICYVPEALVMHSHNYSLRALYGRRFIEGEADAFIFQKKVSFALSMAKGVVRALRDLVVAASARHPRDLFLALPRRTLESIGYWRGNRLGNQRRQGAKIGAEIGKRVALQFHEATRPK